MADLPEDRLTPAPPFTYVGVDYFGPYVTKEGRKERKRYGALFTCLVSRAVHIEVAHTLDTDSFLHALHRFIASPLHPPAASHMGGVWERQIRTTRRILDTLLREHGSRLDDESLQTLMCEVESIINSRPLTVISSDVKDPYPLSPNQILTMKTSIVLPPPGKFQRNDVYMRRRWRRVQYLCNLFWSRWKREYLPTLQERAKWNKVKRNLKVDDVVLVRDENAPRNVWPMGVVTRVEPDSKGLVRSVLLRTHTTELHRPVNKLILMLTAEERMDATQDTEVVAHKLTQTVKE